MLTECRKLSKEETSLCDCHPRIESPMDPQMMAVNGKKSKGSSDPAPVVNIIGCGFDCLNRASYIHCDKKTCPCGIFCTNRPFHKLPTPKVEIYLTANKGWGVRAAEFIPKGKFVVEYAGEVIGTEEMKKRMEEAENQNHPHFYMMEMAPGLIIDAKPKGNIARLLNSSCDPNCVTQKWRDSSTGEIRVGIFAHKDIRPGEEVVYDYNFEHILQGVSNKYHCQCGSSNCRGSMETSQRQGSNDVGRRIEIWWDGDACYYSGKVETYCYITGQYGIHYDDGMREKILLKDHEHRWIDEKRKRRRQNPMAVQDQEAVGEQVQQKEDIHPSKNAPCQIMPEHLQHRLRQALTEGVANLTQLQALAAFIDEKSPSIATNDASLCLDSSRMASEVSLVEYAAKQEFSSSSDQEQDECISSGVETLCRELSEWWNTLEATAANEKMVKLRSQITEIMARINALPPPQILEPVENPGAEQTAGSLHGNGEGAGGSNVSSRGRKRQKKIFGNDFEQDLEVHSTAAGASLSPPARERVKPSRTPVSPGIEAASIIAQMASSNKPSAENKPSRAKSGSQKRVGPTPPSSGLPARTILVAKRLTNSDVTKGRVLLPRAAVEANLSFAVGRAHSLVAKDHEGASWEFTLQSWANGIETRRVFVLEHAGDYIKHHDLKIQDVIGISTTEDGEFMVEYNTQEVCSAAESQQAARAGGQTTVNNTLPAIMPGSINPLIQKNSGRCIRSVHCNKPAGHPGFCMRTPGSSKPKKPATRGRGRGRGRGKRPVAFRPHQQDRSLYYQSTEASEEDDEDHSNEDSAAEAEPGSARYRRSSDWSGGEDDLYRRGGVLTPRFPNSSYDYFGNKHDLEEEEGNLGELSAQKSGGKELHQFPPTSRNNIQLPKYPLPPPPELGPGVPPIFVMAQDANAPQQPSQLRSPLRPSILGRQQQQQHGEINSTQGPIPQSPSAAAIANLPNMGLDDIVDGASPHAYQMHGANEFMRLMGNNSSDIMSILEGTSPTAAKFEAMTSQQGRLSSSTGMPAAPLPLFGAPPPPLGTSQTKGTSPNNQNQVQQPGSKDRQDFDFSSFLSTSGGKPN